MSESTVLQVNSVAGKMGLAVAEAVVGAGLQLVPFSLAEKNDNVDVNGVKLQLCNKSERDAVLDNVLKLHPNVVIVDYTVPQAVNGVYVYTLIKSLFLFNSRSCFRQESEDMLSRPLMS
jgi:dihydrodipicolinate reductase